MGTQQALWSIRAVDGNGVSHVDFLTRREGSRGNQKSAAMKSEAAKSTDEKKTEPIADSAKSGANRSTAKPLPKQPPPARSASNGLYYGLAFASDNILYAAQGGHDSIAVLSLSDSGELKLIDFITDQTQGFPRRHRARRSSSFVCRQQRLRQRQPAGTFRQRRDLRYRYQNRTRPLHLLRQSRRHVEFSAGDCRAPRWQQNLPRLRARRLRLHPRYFRPREANAQQIGYHRRHPASLLLSKDQSHLFVANSFGDTISILDTAQNKVVDTIMLRPAMVRDIPGVTPLGMALSPDEKTLYVALADMNAVALIDFDQQ